MLSFLRGRPEQGKQNAKIWAPPFISPYKYNLPKFKRKTPPSTEIVNKKTPDYGFNDGSLSTLYVSFTTISVRIAMSVPFICIRAQHSMYWCKRHASMIRLAQLYNLNSEQKLLHLQSQL